MVMESDRYSAHRTRCSDAERLRDNRVYKGKMCGETDNPTLPQVMMPGVAQHTCGPASSMCTGQDRKSSNECATKIRGVTPYIISMKLP